MKKQYTDLFVDFDDTIYDTHGNAQIALSELFEYFNWQQHFDCLEDFTLPYWQTNEQLWSQYSKGEITRDYLIVERFRRPLSHGHDLNPTEEYCLQVSDKFLDLCAVKPGLIEGARALLDYLQPKYRLHLCSNGFHEVQYRKLSSSDTLRYFEHIILSEDAGFNKPSAQFFDYAFQVSGANPAATLMIGDNTSSDIIGAKEYGLDQLYFNPKNKDPEQEVTYMVKHLQEITAIL